MVTASPITFIDRDQAVALAQLGEQNTPQEQDEQTQIEQLKEQIKTVSGQLAELLRQQERTL